MARVLVGVPVFRVSELVYRCLASLVGTPADVLVIDNAADADVKHVLRQFPIRTIVNATNEYCNGAWNQVMQHGLAQDYDLIGLGSSDAILSPGWCEALHKRMASFPNEVWIPTLKETPVDAEYADSVAGYFSFLPRAAVEIVYPIPYTLRHWFGDQYMFEKLRRNGWKTAILGSVRAVHEQSAITARTPEAYTVIEQDKVAWKELRCV
jgi:GT2 family glycosyltransferase